MLGGMRKIRAGPFSMFLELSIRRYVGSEDHISGHSDRLGKYTQLGILQDLRVMCA